MDAKHEEILGSGLHFLTNEDRSLESKENEQASKSRNKKIGKNSFWL